MALAGLSIYILKPSESPSCGRQLHAIRSEQGLSLQAVAERLNVSPQAVHQYESGESRGTISLGQLDKVARAIGYRLEYRLVPQGADASPLRRSKPEAPQPAEQRVKWAKRPVAIPRHDIREPERSPIIGPAPTVRAADNPTVEQSLFLENQAADRFD